MLLTGPGWNGAGNPEDRSTVHTGYGPLMDFLADFERESVRMSDFERESVRIADFERESARTTDFEREPVRNNHMSLRMA